MRKSQGCSAAKVRWQDLVRDRDPSPRLKTAIRLHATGAAKSKKQAAEMAGISYGQMAVMTAPSAGNEKVSNLYENVDQLLNDKAIDLSTLKRRLAEEGLRTAGRLMVHSGKDEVQLRAALELMDRHEDTARITKTQIEAPKITEGDAKLLAEALVQAAEARRRHMHVAVGDYVKVDVEKPFDPSVLQPASNEPPMPEMKALPPSSEVKEVSPLVAKILKRKLGLE